MKVATPAIASIPPPTVLWLVDGVLGFLASLANVTSPWSLSNSQPQPVLLQVTESLRAWRASKAAHDVSATTPTPQGMRTTLITPATAFALLSSILSGTEPSTGARNTAP